MRGRSLVAEIQHRPTTFDELTGTGGEWEEFATVYADLRPLTGRELFSAQQVQSMVNFKLETEYVAGVTSEMRVAVSSRVFEIETVLNVNESNRSLELLCVEKV